jgi:hypothetical protein
VNGLTFSLFLIFSFLVDDTKKDLAAAPTTIGFAKGCFETTKGKNKN